MITQGKTKRKRWLSSHAAAKKIQPDWTRRILCDFLIERKRVVQDPDRGSLISSENLRFLKTNNEKEFKLDTNIYTEDFEVSPNFLELIIADFHAMIEENAHEEWLLLEQNELDREMNHKLHHLKEVQLSIGKDYHKAQERLIKLGLKL